MNEVIDRLIDRYRSEHSKYSYYIIALCVAAIGFSISQTMGRSLHQSMWPLALSIFLFGLSVFGGLRFIHIAIGAIATDIDIREIQAGTNEIVIRRAIAEKIHPDHPDLKRIAISAVTDVSKERLKWASFWYKTQIAAFYLGVLAFIGWRVYEMYLLSLTPE